jgi:hypothetical protein
MKRFTEGVRIATRIGGQESHFDQFVYFRFEDLDGDAAQPLSFALAVASHALSRSRKTNRLLGYSRYYWFCLLIHDACSSPSRR